MKNDLPPITAARVAEVVHVHSRLLYRVAYGIVRVGAVAEDICQDAVVKLLKDPRQVRDWTQIRSWLVRTVTNDALVHLRRKRVESTAASGWSSTRPPPQEQADFLLREKLLERLEEMEPEIREVVVLRVMQGLSGVEVQGLLGLSAADVSRKLHAGLHRLRRAMSESTGTK